MKSTSDTNRPCGPAFAARFATVGLLLPLAALTTGGCVSTTVIQTNAVAANTSEEELPDRQLLDVGIIVFDPGLTGQNGDVDGATAGEGAAQEAASPAPAGAAEDGSGAATPSGSGGSSASGDAVTAQVREAEARYIPWVLSETMQQTGYWGAVRVIPAASNSVDLTVRGRIVHSDGERLVLRVEARDATGRLWLERTYDHLAGKLAYRESISAERLDPFQDLYNIIANDLAGVMDTMTAQERERIRQVAELRFAEDLAPQAFGDYLRETDGRLEPRRLPAYSDPMVARMRRIREREYFFFDTLDQHFQAFAAEMDVPYDEWRKYSYDEVVTLRQLRRSQRQHLGIGAAAIAGGLLSNSDSSLGNLAEWGAIVGGIAALKVGFDKGRQKKLNIAALEELNSSFAAEVEPVVMEIEGQTVTLKGSLDEQFNEWRGILREIYALETGQVADASASPAAPRGSSSTATGSDESPPR